MPRSTLPDGYYHVFARGVQGRELLFPGDADRTFFVDLVWRIAERHDWTCHAICVLGTHYHLILEATREQLSAGLQRLNWAYARYYNGRYRGFGHAFASRFGTRLITGDEYLFEACAYVLLNPVRAGLCERVSDWRWSYGSFGLHAAA